MREHLTSWACKRRFQDVYSVNERLNTIARYCIWFPDVPQGEPAFTELQMKQFLFKCMPIHMQHKYERLGHRWFSQDVTRDSMIQFFQ